MTAWVGSLAGWSDYATLTFAKVYSVDSAAKAYERFMRKRLPGVSYFYAVELNPDLAGNHPGSHVHALWADLGVKRRAVWAEWFKLHGINRILPIVPHGSQAGARLAELLGADLHPSANSGQMTVAAYCAKYVCKRGAWWNVRLTPWRASAVHQAKGDR
jgi:hypothetical protein